MIKSTGLLIYPTKTCKDINLAIEELLKERGVCFASIQPDDSNCNHKFIYMVFPVLSDNRIPELIEQWSKNVILPKEVTVHIVITGDFIKYERRALHPVRNEIIRILQSRRCNIVNPLLLVDTPAKACPKNFIKWMQTTLNNKTSHTNIRATSKPLHTQNLMHHLFLTPQWKQLCSILEKDPVVIKSTTDKDFLRLSLVTNSHYPRSLMEDMPPSKQEALWRCLDTIPYINELNIGFANLTRWPMDTPNLYKTINRLDLRGNKFVCFDFLTDFSNITHLNISANHIIEFPLAVCNLKKLRALFCYKNSIEYIPDDIAALKSLVRLSLYRNKLSTIPESIAKCTSLTYLNLGANPIRDLPTSLLDLKFLKELVLRNCALRELPQVVNMLDLQILDISKNFIKVNT